MNFPSSFAYFYYKKKKIQRFDRINIYLQLRFKNFIWWKLCLQFIFNDYFFDPSEQLF